MSPEMDEPQTDAIASIPIKDGLNCGMCGDPLPEGSTKWCTPRCFQRARYLRRKAEGYWDRKYQEVKKEYKRSGAAKAGVSLFLWRKLPREFRWFR